MILFGRKLLCPNGSEGITYADTVVPEGDIIFLPLKTNMDLLSRSNKLVQIPDDGFSFCFGNANYLRDKSCKMLANLAQGTDHEQMN